MKRKKFLNFSITSFVIFKRTFGPCRILLERIASLRIKSIYVTCPQNAEVWGKGSDMANELLIARELTL